jgi:hypothetical protein
MITQSGIAIFFLGGCHAARATRKTDAGQAASSSVPST